MRTTNKDGGKDIITKITSELEGVEARPDVLQPLEKLAKGLFVRKYDSQHSKDLAVTGFVKKFKLVPIPGNLPFLKPASLDPNITRVAFKQNFPMKKIHNEAYRAENAISNAACDGIKSLELLDKLKKDYAHGKEAREFITAIDSITRQQALNLEFVV